MAEQVTHDTLVRELRRLNLFPPEDRQLKELRYKIERRLSSSENASSDTKFSKYTTLLFGLALKSLEANYNNPKSTSYTLEEADSAVAICLDSLSTMGYFGRTLAAAILCNKMLPISEAKDWFETHPNKTAFAVADKIIARNCRQNPERIKLARKFLEKTANLSIDSAVSFFQDIGTGEEELTFGTIENFMSGNYGTQCRKSLSHPDTLDEIDKCISTLPRYPNKELIDDILFHLRTQDPSIMEKILRNTATIADDMSSSKIKEIIPLAGSPILPLSLAALDIIVKFAGSKRGNILADLFNSHPKRRAEIINRIPLLDSNSFSHFMADIPKIFHTPVISALSATIAEEDPQSFGAILTQVLRSSKSEHKNKLKPILNKILSRDSFTDTPDPQLPKARIVEGLDYVKLGAPIVLNIEKKNHRTGFKRIFGNEDDASHALPDRYCGGQIANQRIHKLNRWKSQAQNISFQDCNFSACDFRHSISDCNTYKNCTFEACSFANATYKKCSFTNCTFIACSINNSLVYDCAFRDCSFQAVHFDSSTLFLSNIERCSFKAVSFAGSFIGRTNVTASSFTYADCRESVFYKGQIQSSTFEHSDLTKATFSQSEVQNTPFTQCNCKDFQALNIKTNSPQVLRALQRTLEKRLYLREKLKKRSTGFGNIGEYERGVIYKTVKRWFALRNIDRSHTFFSENNTRRLNWALSKIPQQSRFFIEILPALLHTDVFEKAARIKHLCAPSRICGYSLPLFALEAFDEVFRKTDFKTGGEKSIPIEALMTIGSLGTMAQTKQSDIDCWVCCDFSKTTTENRKNFQVKLTAIEEWALKDFKLEVHFFLMDVEDIRNSLFGLSDEESSGSAQGALLKEEFYRTSLLLAGKPPLWWFSPPEATEEVYKSTAKKISILKGSAYAVDLGNVPRIPKEEFFGASLWQIVKGLKSPFKSIMKSGLLEMYITDSHYTLLCECIKLNILEGRRNLESVDPYMLLYSKLANFYNRTNKPEYKWLTAMALRLKSGLHATEGLNRKPETREEKELVHFATELSDVNAPGYFKEFKSLSDFQSVVALGKEINLFMIKTYMKTRGEQDRLSTISITAEDLTKLGRTIFANFAKRKNKIERLTIPGPRTHFFDSLILNKDDKQNWILQGEYSDYQGRVLQTVIQSERALIPMLAWFYINGLYGSHIKTKTDLSSAPVRERDLKGLFDHLNKFFPHASIFDTPVEESLKPEQMLKAYFVLNFCSGRDSNKITEVFLIYNTNWGETFCQPLPVTTPLIETPEKYLQNEFSALYSSQVKMGQYVPHGSECPGLKIPVR